MISWLIVLIRIFRFSISCDTEDSNHTNCKHCLTPDPRWPGSLVFCKNKHKLFINHASSPVGGFGLDFDDRLILLRQIVCLCIQITVVGVIIRKYQIKTFLFTIRIEGESKFFFDGQRSTITVDFRSHKRWIKEVIEEILTTGSPSHYGSENQFLLVTVNTKVAPFKYTIFVAIFFSGSHFRFESAQFF